MPFKEFIINNKFIQKLKSCLRLFLNNKMVFFLSLILIFFISFLYLISAPRNFPNNSVITIEEGSGVKQVAIILKEHNVIRSATLFSVIVQFSEKQIIQSGDYLFEEKDNLINIARRLIRGDYGADLISVVLFEGMTVKDMANKLHEYNFLRFNPDTFIELAMTYEGYLFPDTYLFSEIVSEAAIIDTMKKNFQQRIGALQVEIDKSGKTLHEIITMASIIEREATEETFQEISDILWHRININMPLQVDATFVYSIGKNSFTVTIDEMRDSTNPYNTYQHFGLPPTPISNPGIKSIRASINNNPTNYLFFLTGRDGKMYYATNLDGHVVNRRLYLD